jgi:hypothetical protein
MRLSVSAPVQLVLVATVVGSFAVLLRPEPVELPPPVRTQKSSPPGRQVAALEFMPSTDRPWSRPQLPEPEAPKATVQPASGPPPLPGLGVEAGEGPTPPLPPLPAAMAQPEMVYLGRIIKDGKTQVFFASNGDPAVLSTGDVLNGSWRIEAISSTDVTLHHLQTGETRLIATGGSADPRPRGATPSQVGQRFLASHPIERQQTE